MKKRAYLSLGSNTGDRATNLHEAITRLSQVGKVVAVSSFYETEPVEFTSQPWFLNCAVGIDTDKTPNELLQAALAIEQAMGRKRTQEKGPRNIDIDILLFEDEVVDEKGLKVPHPGLTSRRFVLKNLWRRSRPKRGILRLRRRCSTCSPRCPPDKLFANSSVLRKLRK